MKKEIAAFRGTRGAPQLREKRGRGPLEHAFIFLDHPPGKFARRLHVFGKRDQIPGKLFGISVQLAGAIFQQEIDGVPKSLRGEHMEGLCYNHGAQGSGLREESMRNLAMVIVAVFASAAAVGFAQVTRPVDATAPATSAMATAAKAEQELQKAEKDRFEAMVKADAGELDKLLGAELSYTHTNAQVQDKAGFISDIRSKNIRYVSIEPNDIHVTVFGTTGVVTGGAALHVIQNGNNLTIKIPLHERSHQPAR